jgi:hypothetical protein
MMLFNLKNKITKFTDRPRMRIGRVCGSQLILSDYDNVVGGRRHDACLKISRAPNYILGIIMTTILIIMFNNVGERVSSTSKTKHCVRFVP